MREQLSVNQHLVVSTGRPHRFNVKNTQRNVQTKKKPNGCTETCCALLQCIPLDTKRPCWQHVELSPIGSIQIDIDFIHRFLPCQNQAVGPSTQKGQESSSWPDKRQKTVHTKSVNPSTQERDTQKRTGHARANCCHFCSAHCHPEKEETKIPLSSCLTLIITLSL